MGELYAARRLLCQFCTPALGALANPLVAGRQRSDDLPHPIEQHQGASVLAPPILSARHLEQRVDCGPVTGVGWPTWSLDRRAHIRKVERHGALSCDGFVK
jgi:hypothetical protein